MTGSTYSGLVETGCKSRVLMIRSLQTVLDAMKEELNPNQTYLLKCISKIQDEQTTLSVLFGNPSRPWKPGLDHNTATLQSLLHHRARPTELQSTVAMNVPPSSAPMASSGGTEAVFQDSPLFDAFHQFESNDSHEGDESFAEPELPPHKDVRLTPSKRDSTCTSVSSDSDSDVDSTDSPSSPPPTEDQIDDEPYQLFLIRHRVGQNIRRINRILARYPNGCTKRPRRQLADGWKALIQEAEIVFKLNVRSLSNLLCRRSTTFARVEKMYCVFKENFHANVYPPDVLPHLFLGSCQRSHQQHPPSNPRDAADGLRPQERHASHRFNDVDTRDTRCF